MNVAEVQEVVVARVDQRFDEYRGTLNEYIGNLHKAHEKRLKRVVETSISQALRQELQRIQVESDARMAEMAAVTQRASDLLEQLEPILARLGKAVAD